MKLPMHAIADEQKGKEEASRQMDKQYKLI